MGVQTCWIWYKRFDFIKYFFKTLWIPLIFFINTKKGTLDWILCKRGQTRHTLKKVLQVLEKKRVGSNFSPKPGDNFAPPKPRTGWLVPPSLRCSPKVIHFGTDNLTSCQFPNPRNPVGQIDPLNRAWALVGTSGRNFLEFSQSIVFHFWSICRGCVVWNFPKDLHFTARVTENHQLQATRKKTTPPQLDYN